MVRKLLIGVVAALVLVGAALFVIPSFIDWGQYKGRVSDAAEEALGRRLDIGGALSLSLLPLPTLVAEDVRLANLPGGTAAHMAEIAEVRVRISLPALFGGALQVESVRLVSPVLILERLPSGQGNWRFEPPPPATNGRPGGAVSAPLPPTETAAGATGDAAPSDDGSAAPPLDLRLDSVEVVDGRVIYRDPAAGLEEELTGIDAELSAQSLRGPFRGTGRLRGHGLPITFEGVLGGLGGDRAAPVSLTLDALDGAATVRFSGLVTSESSRALRGEVEVAAPRLPAILTALGLAPPPPALLTLPIALEGRVEARADEAAVDNLSLRLGDAEARGTVAVAYGRPVPRITADLSMSSIDLATWVAAGDGTADGPAGPVLPAPPDPAAGDPATATATAASDGPPPPPPTAAAAFALPRGIEVAVDLRAEAVAWREGVIRQAHMAAELADGEVTIHELTAQGPGSSSLAVFGFVGDGAADQAATGAAGGTASGPQLDLTVEARSDNLRAALGWLGVDVAAVPGGRLTQFEAKARVAGSPREIQVRTLDARIDTTTLRGAATIVTGGRPAIGLTLRAGSLNLDAYLPAPPPTPGPVLVTGAASGAAPGNGDRGAVSPADEGTPEATAATAPTGAAGLPIDGSFRIDVDTLTWRGVPLRRAHAEGSLVDGRLEIRDTGIGDALGASVSLNGAVDGLGETPRLNGLAYVLAIPEPSRLARAFALDLPVPAESLGAVTGRGTLDGPLDALTVDTRTAAAGGTLTAKGMVGGLTGAAPVPAFDLAVALDHPEARRLVALAGPDYRPVGPLGALSLTARASGKAGLLALSDLALTVGDETLRGEAAIDASATRPALQATLSTDRLTLTRFLSAERQALLDDGRGWPATAEPGHQLAAASARWSEAPLDLAALRAVDLEATLKAGALIFRSYTLGDADLAATLKGGVLDVPRLTGSLFGGALKASGRLDATSDAAAAKGTLAVDGARLAEILAAVQAGTGATGTATLTAEATASGGSEAALIASLAGTGAATVSGLTVTKDAGGRGGAAAVLGPVLALNQMAAFGQAATGAAALDSRFTIDQGVVRFDTLSVKSNLYQAALAGTVDLPLWTVDIGGEAKMSQNLLTGLLGKRLKLPETVPISVTGSLEAPKVSLRTGQAAASGDGTAAAGTAATSASEASEETVPHLLDQLLGGQTESGAETAPTSGSQGTPREQLLRGLLRQLQKQ
jgi:uncharacterized protein involved in outer membrane biogenesis